MRLSAKQGAFAHSRARFDVVPCGRRSGKTEIGKRRVVRAACSHYQYDDAIFICGAPTRAQAVKIFWKDLKRLVPADLVLPGRHGIREGDKTINLRSGVSIWIVGLDVPERIEGIPIVGGVLTEFGNLRPETWKEHIRPTLTDRDGWMICEGVPEGRNHYHDLYVDALEDESGVWAVHHWTTAEVLHLALACNVMRLEKVSWEHALPIGREKADAEIAQAEHDLDPLTFQQEYEAAFVKFEGLVFYRFNPHINVIPLEYDPELDLHFVFDFNVDPGVAGVLQEQRGRTCIIGEVYIEGNSNTDKVCQRLCDRWKHHKGNVYFYGDPSGYARKTSAREGVTDWVTVRLWLNKCFGKDRVVSRVPRNTVPERASINAMNSRLRAMDGTVRWFVDTKCKWTRRSMEGCELDSNGGIHKPAGDKLTHLADGHRYYVYQRFPVRGGRQLVSQET